MYIPVVCIHIYVVCVFVCDLMEINESEESFVPASKKLSLKS